ncbi:hypothetical protein IKS57_02320 [bacterium]|nr:hypothetical protein [bacterium]
MNYKLWSLITVANDVRVDLDEIKEACHISSYNKLIKYLIECYNKDRE